MRARLLLLATALLACEPPAPPPPDPAPAAVVRARRLLGEAPAQVASALADFHPKTPQQRCEAAALRGRAALRVQAPPEAEPRVAAALEACGPAAGAPKQRSDLAGALAWLRLIGQRDVAGAEVALATMAEAVRAWPAGAAPLAYYRALVQAELRDWRAARQSTAEALGLAERFDDAKVRWAAAALAADVDGRLGDHEGAIARLRRLVAQANGCHKAALQNNLAWALLGAPDDGVAAVEARSAEARRWLEAAVGHAACRPGLRANAWTSLARLALEAGDLAGAEAALDQALAALPEPEPAVGVWQDVLRARLQLARGAHTAAAEAFAALAARAQRLLDPVAEWQALAGRAEALQAAGSLQAARAFAAAEGALGAMARAVPLADGHHRFYGDRAGFVGRHADALVAQGAPAEAAAVIRRHRRRALDHVALQGRLGGLTPTARSAWAAGLRTYRTLQAQITEDVQAMALLDKASRRARRRAVAAKRARAHAGLDAAYRAVGVDPGQALLPPLAPDALTLVLTSTRVVALDATGARATVPWDGDGAALLARLDAALADVAVVRVLAGGAMGDVDVHAWPWRGQPLGLSRPVLYSLDLGPAQAGGDGAVVLSDPRGDLPQARVEGARVADALGARHLMGAQVSQPAARRALGAKTLHFAGHGLVDLDSPLRGALALADGGRLSVADLLAAPRVPTTVALSGCETARAAGRDLVVGLGLAQAFLAAGSAQVMAASRPVDDALAATFFDAWYAAGPNRAPAQALQAAWRAVRVRAPDGDWATFRLLVR